MFIRLLSSHFGESLFYDRHIARSKRRIKCSSLNYQPCDAGPTLVNIKCNKPPYYPFTVSANKCCGSCNTTDDTYDHIRVTSKVKSMIKLKYLITDVNDTKFLIA